VRRPGIHFRLVAAAVLVICATSFTLGYVGVKIFHGFVRERFDDRMSFMARYLALNAELGILIGEKDMLANQAENLLAEKDVAEVTITSRQEGLMAHVSKKITGPLHDIEAPVVVKSSREESRAFNSVGAARADNQNIGRVRIKYSTAGINRFLTRMTVRFLILAAAMAGICVVVFFFVSRTLVAPLRELSDTAKKVGEGDLETRVHLTRLPETREVALAFNSMLDSIEKSRRAVEAANKQMMRQNTLAEMGKFSLMVAHEVKNPLGIMKSSLDSLKKRSADTHSDTMIAYIEDEISRLNRLIEDFLAFARPVKPYFREVDFNAVLKKVLDSCRMQFKDRTVHAEIAAAPSEAMVYADPDLCERMVGNLLKNAFDASPAGGSIIVRAYREGEMYTFDIADEGPGIDETIIDKIFEPFFTTRSKGTGLGLAYVVQIVNTHDGCITAENRQSGGALFRVKIPLQSSSAEGV